MLNKEELKWIKSKFGFVRFIRTDANYYESIKKIPENSRVMKYDELIILFSEQNDIIECFNKTECPWLGESFYGEYVWVNDMACNLMKLQHVLWFGINKKFVNYKNKKLKGIWVILTPKFGGKK